MHAAWFLRLAGVCIASSVVAVLLAAPWICQELVVCGCIGMAGAIYLAWSLRGWSRALAAALWSCGSIGIAFYWAPAGLADAMSSSRGLGWLVFVPLVIWDSIRSILPIALAVWMARDLAGVWWRAGLAAAVLETVMPSVFPWRWGYMLIPWNWTIQASDLFGPSWTTLVLFAHAGAILAAAIGLAGAVRSKEFISLPARLLRSPAIWLCAGNLLYGAAATMYWTSQTATAHSLRLALVQVDPRYTWSTDCLRRLTATVSKNVDLVCWPESSGGVYDILLDDLSDEQVVFEHSREPERGLRPWPSPVCPLLLGGKSYVGNREAPAMIYQSALLVDCHEHIVGRYQKRHLMPFGEYVPGKDWIPGVRWLFGDDEAITAGEEATVLRLQTGARIGVMLCYEDMVPSAARTLVNQSANLLVTLSNGAEFTNPLTLAQHRLLAQLRAVESRKCFVRCTATGETCVISPLGRIDASLPPQISGVLRASARLIEGKTIYDRWGEVFPVFCFLLLVADRFRTYRYPGFNLAQKLFGLRSL